jgi:hypothetical protein
VLNTVLKKDPKILLIKKTDPSLAAVLVVLDNHQFVHVYTAMKIYGWMLLDGLKHVVNERGGWTKKYRC